MNGSEMIAAARLIAKLAHKGQKDKAGRDYFTHPEAVAAMLETPEEKTVGYLHDTVEDTDVTVEEIRAVFGDEIADAVALMTHADGVPYMDYVAEIKKNPIARAVKLADLRHNSDLTRLDVVDEKALKRVEKYKKAIALLEEA